MQYFIYHYNLKICISFLKIMCKSGPCGMKAVKCRPGPPNGKKCVLRIALVLLDEYLKHNLTHFEPNIFIDF